MTKKFSGILSGLLLAVCIFTFSVQSAADSVSPPETDAECAIVADADTGQILYAKNMDKRTFSPLPNRILTVLASIRKGNLRNTVTAQASSISSDLVPRDMPHIAAEENEKFVKDDMLYAVILSGAADAANILASADSTLPEFTDEIKTMAEEAGCTETGIANANGREAEGNFTSVRDICAIAAMAYENEGFRTIWQTYEYIMTATEQNGERTVLSGCKILSDGEYNYEFATGGAAGWAKNGGYSSAVTASNGEINLICVLSECSSPESRWTDTKKLCEYFFNNYEHFTYPAKNITIEKEALRDTDGKITSFVFGTAEKDITVLAPKGTTEENVTVSTHYDTDRGTFVIRLLLQVDTPLYPQAANVDAETTAKRAGLISRITKGSTVGAVFLIAGIVIAVIALAAAAMFIYAKIEQEKVRKRKRIERKRRRQAQAIREMAENNRSED